MFVGGMCLLYLEVPKMILLTIKPTTTNTQMGGIALGFIALGALVFFISIVGCCGALNDSRGCLALVSAR